MADINKIKEIFIKQKKFFNNGKTHSIEFRKSNLKKLYNQIISYEDAIKNALYQDLRKNPFESYVTEIGLVLKEIKFMINNLEKFSRPISVNLPLIYNNSKGSIYKEPLGNILIIVSWNYPFLLNMMPLIGSIAAGNCTIIKPSESSTFTAKIINELISEIFIEDYIKVINGDKILSEKLSTFPFDKIFYTGNSTAGSKVAENASKNLTPCILELGGKNPCIVNNDCNLKVAARKITWAKFINAGQTCIAPDYIIVHNDIKSELIEYIKNEIENFYGSKIHKSKDYSRIINEENIKRLNKYLKNVKIVYGGNYNILEKYFEPTLVTDVSFDDPIMTEEIFGPILPILTYNEIGDIFSIVSKNQNPLSLYIFSNDDVFIDKILRRISSGNACVNDVVHQFSCLTLPFGGVGKSGTGRYHGKSSFDCFSNEKSVLKTKDKFEFSFIYPPYRKLKNKMIKLFLK